MTDQEVNEFLESMGGLKSAYYPDRIITSRMFECGSGWNKLICDLIQNLIDIGWNKEIAQIKEKFGTLRFYPGGCTDEQWKLIGEAERKSATICEYCGTTENVKLYTDGWYTTECLSCRNKK